MGPLSRHEVLGGLIPANVRGDELLSLQMLRLNAGPLFKFTIDKRVVGMGTAVR